MSRPIGISLEQLADEMISSARAAVDNQEDKAMQALVAEHGRGVVLAHLLGGAIRGVNPDGAGFDIKVDGQVVCQIPRGK